MSSKIGGHLGLYGQEPGRSVGQKQKDVREEVIQTQGLDFWHFGLSVN